MITAVLVFASFSILLGFTVWWVWREREQARFRAETNEELARLGARVRTVAHDLDNLFSIVLANLSSAPDLPDHELKEMLADVERAALSASRMVRGIRARASVRVGSAEPIVRLAVALVQRSGIPIELRVEGEFTFRGAETEAYRVVQNVMVNAVRETMMHPDGRIDVVVDERGIRVTNPTRDPSSLDASIYAAGKSGAGSTGLGLSIAHDNAASIGWTIAHELDGHLVTFVIAAAAPPLKVHRSG